MVNYIYSDLVKQLQDLKPQDSNFARRLNELIGINELLTTLNTARTLEETLDIILLTLLGQYGCLRGVIIVKSAETWRVGISKGLKNIDLNLEDLPAQGEWGDLPSVIHGPEESPETLIPHWQSDLFQLLLPVKNENNLVGLIFLGKSLLSKTAAAEKEPWLATIADFGGVIIGNSLYRHDLEKVNRQLQRQIFQLNTLYEITESFARCYENENVFQILANNLMGQFFISRCAVLGYGEPHCRLIFNKGLKLDDLQLGPCTDFLALDQWLETVTDRSSAPCHAVSAFMQENRLQYALPILSEGKRWGLLLLGGRLDRKKLTPPDKDFILSIANQSAVALENVHLQKEALEKKRMEKELQLAREIQQRLLPKDLPVIPGYELAVEMRPYYLVGGDFYDFIPGENGLLSICLADVSGKSLPASMIMSTTQACLRALNSFAGLSPKEVIEKLNFHMWQSTQSNKFITMFYAVLDPAEHTLHYINAGHNRPILVNLDKSVTLLDKGGMVIGMFPNFSYQVGCVTLQKGAKLLIYTDGLSEVRDKAGEEYGDDRLATVFSNTCDDQPAQTTKDFIMGDVMGFSSNRMVDDMTLLVIRRNKEHP